ncbi:hypothetical protein ACFPM0_21975 [Pseudonocardia sulfidoxydans]|uniref:hypothetical protein n=1 Tax=Pseudonocardia sulfidoxydans TaxID=54011 RepID=UPI003605C7C7
MHQSTCSASGDRGGSGPVGAADATRHGHVHLLRAVRAILEGHPGDRQRTRRPVARGRRSE